MQTSLPHNTRRANRRPRENDRKSGNPKTGVKAQEKRNGAGKGNWGKEDEVQEEKPVQEEASAEKEVTNEGEEAQVEEEPKEPEPVEFSLDEYYAQMNSGVEAAPKKEVRKANDGQEIKGKALKGAKPEVYDRKELEFITKILQNIG